MYLLYPQQAKNISRKSLIDLFYVLDNFLTKINTFINIFIRSPSFITSFLKRLVKWNVHFIKINE